VRARTCLLMLLVGLCCCGRGGSDLRADSGLRIRAQGRAVDASSSIELRPGEAVQLSVDLLSGATARDVTRDPGTRYYSTAPWALEVSPDGRVKALAGGTVPGGGPAAAVLVQVKAEGRLRVASVLFAVGPGGSGAKQGLAVSAPAKRLGVGQTVELVVRSEDGRPVTAPLRYYTTDETVLIPEGDGRVTAIGTHGQARESAIIGVEAGNLHGAISFDVVAEGPGPGLSVAPEARSLREGETTRIRVAAPGKGDAPLSASSTGTRYLTFSGFGRSDADVLAIDESGTARATSSLGRFNSRDVVVFVRNGPTIGWTSIAVVRGPGQSSGAQRR
jgi:hypothetical protein